MAQLRQKHVLLVLANDKRVLTKVKQSLRREPYKIISLQNGLDAIEVVSKQKPTQVLADLKLPDMTGLELFEGIKKKSPYISRILLTSKNNTQRANLALEKEIIHSFLVKPINSAELKAVLRLTLNHVQTQARLIKANERLKKKNK